MNNPEDLLTVLRDVDSPPGGWKYTVPETGVTVTGQFYGLLKDRVVKHLRANGHTVTDEMLLLIEDGACRETQTPGWCKKRGKKPVDTKLPHLTLAHIDRFLKSIWSALVDRDFVSREEAERRAEICRNCPIITGGITGCSGCYTMLRKAQSFVQKNPIQMEPDKQVCGACGCFTPLLVWFKNTTLDRAAGKTMPKYQEGHCWRLGN